MEFKVGDKVKLQSVGYGVSLLVGDICEVIDISKFKTNGCVLVRNAKGFEGWQRVERMELITPKITKNQRITALEEKVAELQAQLDELKQPQFHVGVDWAIGKGESVVAPILTNNQKRAAIIEKAKLELAEQLPWWNAYQNEFVINTEKRTVVLLRKDLETGKVNIRGIAKCHPNDVFNEHLGKIIAFGRATGYPTEEFRQAVQPDEVVVGMEIQYKPDFELQPNKKRIIKSINGKKITFTSDKYYLEYNNSVLLDDARVTNDTNAEYPS